MNYTVFDDHIIGQSHVKMNVKCEDYSAHYCDENGRYAIAVICDGHSDPRCFRSELGARFGCEAAISILTKFFNAYYGDDASKRIENFQEKEDFSLNRLRAAFVVEWNRRVNEDLKQNPITAEEYKPLDCPQYRSAMRLYQSGKAQSNIYGATLVCAAICEDFHLAMQIGDGIVVRLNGEGKYNTPLPEDDKNEMEGPASICDSDLLSRERAFRIVVDYYPPQAMFVTSDGIGDMPMTVVLRDHLCQVQRKLLENQGTLDNDTDGFTELNDENKAFLNSFIEYYSKQGVEDDCCLGGFFSNSVLVEDVYLEKEELDALYQDLRISAEAEESRYHESRARIEEALRNSGSKIQTIKDKIANLENEIMRLNDQLGIRPCDITVRNGNRILNNDLTENVRLNDNQGNGDSQNNDIVTTTVTPPKQENVSADENGARQAKNRSSENALDENLNGSDISDMTDMQP